MAPFFLKQMKGNTSAMDGAWRWFLLPGKQQEGRTIMKIKLPFLNTPMLLFPPLLPFFPSDCEQNWKSGRTFPGKCPNIFVIYVSREPLLLGNSQSPLVQEEGRVKLLLSCQLKLAKVCRSWWCHGWNFPPWVVVFGVFAVPSHVAVPINMYLLRKALPM